MQGLAHWLITEVIWFRRPYNERSTIGGNHFLDRWSWFSSVQICLVETFYLLDTLLIKGSTVSLCNSEHYKNIASSFGIFTLIKHYFFFLDRSQIEAIKSACKISKIGSCSVCRVIDVVARLSGQPSIMCWYMFMYITYLATKNLFISSICSSINRIFVEKKRELKEKKNQIALLKLLGENLFFINLGNFTFFKCGHTQCYSQNGEKNSLLWKNLDTLKFKITTLPFDISITWF